MSAKRPPVDLMALTSEQATAMPEAVQRTATVGEVVQMTKATFNAGKVSKVEGVRTENLEALAFKVPPAFRKRFRRRAVDVGLKLNQLLFEALEAWEEKQGIKK